MTEVTESDFILEQTPEVPAELVGLMPRFARYLTNERNYTTATAFIYATSIERVSKFVGKAPALLTSDDVRKFLAESTYHPSTKNGCVVAIKSFHQWGILEGLWAPGPILALRGPKMVRNPQRWLSADECRRVMAACRSSNEHRLVYLGLYAGLRVTEAALIGEDEWQSDRLRFEGKGRKVREVPIHPELQAKRDIILQRSTTRGTLRHTARSLAYVTEIDFTSHALRRSFAEALSEARVPREVIGKILGHGELSVTERYAPVRFSELQEAIELLSYRQS